MDTTPLAWRPPGRRAASSASSGGAMAPTASSEGKRTRLPSRSQWRDLRQTVRIRATVDTPERRPQNARIADLCAEDRDKVAKLIRRIVDVGKMHEESEAAFAQQRDALEHEIQTLRLQARQDAREMESLGERLQRALAHAREYQERVNVLEDASEAETQHRLETDQTMDLLKLEVDKLRCLVQQQQDELKEQLEAERTRHRHELDRVREELREAQQQLIEERRERLVEKQRELEQRVEEAKQQIHHADDRDRDVKEEAVGSKSVAAVGANDLSSFFNTSTELPEKIKDVMDEWKKRMEEALQSTRSAIAEPSATRELDTAKESFVCTQCASHRRNEIADQEQRDGALNEKVGREDSGDASPRNEQQRLVDADTRMPPDRAMLPPVIPRVKRLNFDEYLAQSGNLDMPERRQETRRRVWIEEAEEVEEEEKEERQNMWLDEEEDLEEVDWKRPSREQRRRRRGSRPRSSPDRHPRRSASPSVDFYSSDVDRDAARERRKHYETLGKHVAQALLLNDTRGSTAEPESRLFPSMSPSATQQPIPRSRPDQQMAELLPDTGFELYDDSLYDVVQALEMPPSPGQLHSHTGENDAVEDTADRIEALRRELAEREKRLNQLEVVREIKQTRQIDNDDDALAILEQVKDVYALDLLHARQRTPRPSAFPPSTRLGESPLGPPLSARDLSVREAIEKDMEELLREEAFQNWRLR